MCDHCVAAMRETVANAMKGEPAGGRVFDVPIDVVMSIKHLVHDEMEGMRIPLVIGPYSAYVLVGILQLAWRHPELAMDMRRVIWSFGHQVQEVFRGGHLWQSVEDGWDTRHDVAFVDVSPDQPKAPNPRGTSE